MQTSIVVSGHLRDYAADYTKYVIVYSELDVKADVRSET